MKAVSLIAAMLVSTTLFTAAFAADKKTESKSVSKTKEISLHQDVSGDIKWTGFGVGKSHSGLIQLKSGSLDTKNESITGGVFIFDMTTLSGAKFEGSEKLTGHLKSADFFNVEKFNTATFKITHVTEIKGAKAGEATHEITGDLTIKDKTNPITFKAVVVKEGKVMKASGTIEIMDRTKYDIVYNSKQFSALSKLGDKLIEDNIKIDINVMTK